MRWVNKNAIALSLLVASCGQAPETELDQLSIANSAADIGQHLDLTYLVIANRGEGNCQLSDGRSTDGAPCYEAAIRLESETPLNLSGAKIFFSQTDPVGLVEGTTAAIRHVNGDLHVLEIGDSIPPLTSDHPFEITFTVKGINLTDAKIMPNFYVVDTSEETALIDSTQEGPREYAGRRPLLHLAPLSDDLGGLRRAAIDKTPLATPSQRFTENDGVSFRKEAINTGIIPAPLSVHTSPNSEPLNIERGLSIELNGIDREQIEVGIERLVMLGVPLKENGIPLHVSLIEDPDIDTEGYRLAISSDRITIEAGTPVGAFYAVQSIAALITPGTKNIPVLTIEDAPRFGFRGMHIDIARNFHGPETLLSLMDQMAAYKLNRLHLHLADDEGWRLEIPGLPELTEVGSRRCHDLEENTCLLPQLGSGPNPTGSGTGYLSTDEYKKLLVEAKRRHIEVIPSFDMPGHARAAVKSMEARHRRLMVSGKPVLAEQYLLSDPDDSTEYLSIQYYKDNTINVCRESSFAFIEKVLDELITLHTDAGTPLSTYHIGADETAGAWVKSPDCVAFLSENEQGIETSDQLSGYFIERVAGLVADKGITPAAWSDGLSHVAPDKMPQKVQSNAWGTLAGGGAQTAHTHANLGWDVVVSLPDALYFDFPYEAHPSEGGYYWAARRVSTRKVFSISAENLPIHAAYWRDRDEQPFTIDDRPGSSGDPDYRPLQEGTQFSGMQGHIWTETVRDAETLQYQVFPRMLALAERSWHEAAWEVPYDHAGGLYTVDSELFTPELAAQQLEDWNRFATILVAKEFPKLEMAGVRFRLPQPGARLNDGQLLTNTALPGLSVEYLQDGFWYPAEQQADPIDETITLRTTLPDTETSSRPDAIQHAH